jgi:hypothetical protein
MFASQLFDNNFDARFTKLQVQILDCLQVILTGQLFPDGLSQRDHEGKLPLHHTATRKWHAWDWRSEAGADSAAGKLLRGESLQLLEYKSITTVVFYFYHSLFSEDYWYYAVVCCCLP